MRLLRAKADIEATLVVDESVCKIVPITAREAWLVAKAAGTTRVAFRFQDDRQPPFTCLVRVAPSPTDATAAR
jgi:Flp pilus assembly secretin CpaC